MTKILESIFGANWRTSVFGIVQLLAGTFYNYYQTLNGSAFDWKLFGMQLIAAFALFLTKDSKVTGGTVPATVEAEERTDTLPKN